MNGEKLITIILIVFGGVILLAVGYFFGMGSVGKNQEIVLNSENPQSAVKIIDSKIIKNISASGKVSNIGASGRTITITEGEENMDIYIKEEAQIISIVLVPPGKGETSPTTKQVKAEFSDIKIGDQVSATIKILAENRIEAASLIIISGLGSK